MRASDSGDEVEIGKEDKASKIETLTGETVPMHYTVVRGS